MHHDKKVGLGLGILLVGIVGAFFFREEPSAREPLPEFQLADSLDREISESLVNRPNPNAELEVYEQQYRPSVDLQGIETTGQEQVDSELSATSKKVFDEEFDFLNEPPGPVAEHSEEIVKTEDSDPSGNRQQPTGESIEDIRPTQDLEVSRSTSPRELSSGTGMFTAERSSTNEASLQPFVEDKQPATEKIIQKATETSGTTDAASSENTLDSRSYIVQQGDTLSSISSKLLGHQIHYQQIFELNRDQLASPDALRPGMELKIPATEQLKQPKEISLTEQKDSPRVRFKENDDQVSEPQPPKRDRRVIVPRRVRLNQPVANNPDVNRGRVPRATFTPTPSEEESNDLLPTLDGLEPLELPR